ncbi:putative disease resistance protein [Senna tora]|uniref:Putative disease resistance protein n=1 Tax=Senna tora TaxID=362788 RepID=A0A834XG18_9FABA|nr:putative disease resistance protein [Senna tora]
MGGTGKTTLATQVGKEVEESKLFDKVIFVVVSNPPDLKRIRDGIARQLGLPLEEGKESEEHAKKLWSRISNGEEKILIIQDDVWQELNLKDIGIPLGFHQKGHSSVFLTIRDMRVCKKMGCGNTINLELLSEKDSLNLFLLHAGISVDSSSSDMRNMASNIVKESGRLPVAIVPVAKTLKSESPKDWEAALIRLQNFDPTLHDIDEDLIEVYKSLRLSYDNLKNEKAKELFLLCSLFPEDFELPIEDFSRIAIGLGLCGKADNYYIARSQVPEIMHKLIDSSLLLKAKRGCVKMQDLVREAAQWIGKEEIQVIMDSKTIFKENIRYSSWIIDGTIPNDLDGNKLEFLLVRINAEEFVELPNELFKDMIRLRVLILIVETDKIWGSLTLSLPVSFHSLRNIQTLILERWKLGDICILGNLQSLETLQLTLCSITKLPNEFQALEKLRLLGLKYCDIERDNPFKVIERIPKQEELYYVRNTKIELDKENELDCVGTFPALQRYHIIGSGFKYSYHEEVDASILRCFIPGALKTHFSEEATLTFLAKRAEILELGECQKTGRNNLIPDIVPMENEGMIRIFLYSWPEIECVIHTKNLQSGVPIFSKLFKLKLRDMDVKELCCGPLPTDFLKQLETLCLGWCRKLESTLLKGKLDLGKLKSIVLRNCSMSSIFHPSTAWSLKQLETLSIYDCDQLEYKITNEGAEEDDHDDIIFPTLKEMVIYGVPNFINILESQSYHHKSSPISTTVRDGMNIVKDDSPTYTLSWAPLCCFFRPKPSATTIGNTCVSEATLPNNTSSQASKTELVLDRVQCLLRPPLNPHNMREMTITHCSNITSLFTFPISAMLLEKLEVKKCRGLKHLITDKGDGHDHMNKISIFPKLKMVSIKNCRLLESLFPACHCTTFDDLKSLKISRAHKLRYVFGKCYCEDNLAHNNQNVEIRLPTLEELLIHDVPNMVNICGENSYMTTLSLQTIALIDCPQLPVRRLPDFKVGLHETQDLTSRKVLEIQPENLKVPERFVHDCPNISLTSAITISNDDVDDKDAFEIPFLEASSEDEEILEDQDDEVKATSDEVAFQSKKEATQAVVDEDLEIQEENNNTQNMTESIKAAANEAFNQVPTFDIPAMSASLSNSIPQQKPSPVVIQEIKETGEQDCPKLENATIENEIMDSEELSKASPAPLSIPLQNESPQNTKFSVGKGPSSEKNIKPTSTTHSKPVISHPEPLTSTKVHEKKPRGDREALDESLSTKEPPGRVDRPANEVSSKEGSNKTTLEDTSAVISSVSSSKKHQAVTKPTDQEDISCNIESPQGQITVKQLNEINNDEEIKVEHTKVGKFEEDDLTRLFRIMEEDTDMGVGMPYIPNIAAIEDDNEVAKAFADLEASLKMDLNKIASSEEDNLRLQNALKFLSSHCSEEDGAPSPGLSATIDSLHQEVQSILSSFKQASSTISTFTELEGKEKHMINEELPTRKLAANTLNSDIDKTEKSMAELKEQILRLQAELNSKEKEFKECEIKLSCLEEQKKKSVWDNMGFMKEFVDVKKDSQFEENYNAARNLSQA